MSDRDTWFRGGDWSAPYQAKFEARLRRSRNKVQYLRAKGKDLIETDDANARSAGLGLLHRALEHPDLRPIELAGILELLGDGSLAAGRLVDAERFYRECFALYDDHHRANQTSGVTDLSLAEVLISKGTPAGLAEAEALLSNEWLKRMLLWNIDHYRYARANARVQQKLGNGVVAARWAQAALTLLATQTAQVVRLPKIGMAHASVQEIEELRGLAAMA
jgi:hypothetical protein